MESEVQSTVEESPAVKDLITVKKQPSADEIQISVKEHPDIDEVVLAACDHELLDQILETETLHLHVKPSFYHETTHTLEEFTAKLLKVKNANLVGKHVVQKAVDLGLVAEGSVLKINDVPYAIVIVSNQTPL